MGKWKYTLKLEIYLVDDKGNRELKEEMMTSPEAFFEQFPVHKSKLVVSREGQNSLIIKEEDEYKSKTYLAIVTDPRTNSEDLSDYRALKELFVNIRAQI